ncbi:neutral ceramidase 2 [Tanacetum coccineum]
MVYQLTMFHVQRVDMVINPPWNLPFLGAKGLTSPEQTATGKGISNPLMAVMVCPKPYGIQLTNVSSTEIWKLLLRDVAASFDSAVHRDHAGSFDAAVPSLVSAACVAAAAYFVPAVFQSSCFEKIYLETWIDIQTNTRHFQSVFTYLLVDVALLPDKFESTRIIGERQFKKAAELFQSASKQLKGKVGYRHSYIDFSDLSVRFSNVNESVRTCPAAMGFAFAARTTDGPDAFDFKQGDDKGNAFWKLVGGLLKKPDEKQMKCQDPKPILIDSGEMHEPYDWAVSSTVIPCSIIY